MEVPVYIITSVHTYVYDIYPKTSKQVIRTYACMDVDADAVESLKW